MHLGDAFNWKLLKTEERIILRSVEPDDLDFLYAWENNRNLWLVSGTTTPYSKETLKKYLFSVHDVFKDGQLRMIICLEELPIGMVDLYEVNFKDRHCGIGIFIDEKHRQYGFAQNALEQIIDYCFTTLNLHQVYCGILPDNRASINLFESLGFVHTATRKDWYSFGGNFKDEYIYQLISK